MLPLDYLHAFCLLAVALYIWLRERPRLLLVPLMLISFFVLYGVGNIVYFAGADTVPAVRTSVTLSLITMWIGLLAGIELAGASMPALAARAQQVIRDWKRTRVSDRSNSNQLLAALGVVVAAYLLGTFLYLGKLGELRSFLSLDVALDRIRYRAEFAGEGGYVYQVLVASVAPFLSFLLLVKGFATRQRYLVRIGFLLCLAVFAGKLGTFQKVPWLIYLLQLIAVFQATRRLEFGIGRVVFFSIIIIVGAMLAALIALPQIDSADVFEWLAYRFFEVNNEVVYQTFYVYPHYLPHTWGMNIGLVHAIFGSGDLLSAHSRVANFFGADGATFDAFFISDAWVDFSYAGVIVMSVVVGYVVKAIDLWVMSLGKIPLAIAILGSGIYGLFQLQVTSAFTASLTGGLVLIPLLALTLSGLANDLARDSRGHPMKAAP